MPDEPVVPDLAGWRVEIMPELPDTTFITTVPDCVCEVLSRSTEKLNRDEKLPPPLLLTWTYAGRIWALSQALRPSATPVRG